MRPTYTEADEIHGRRPRSCSELKHMFCQSFQAKNYKIWSYSIDLNKVATCFSSLMTSL